MKNQKLRDYAKAKNVYLWQVAEKMGMWDVQLSRRLRHELSEPDLKKCMDVIDEIAEKGDME